MTKITVELSENQAWAYAEFLKRIGFEDYRRLAVESNEAYLMQEAGESIRKALESEGIDPR